jgi:hypothetical protein
MPLILGTVFVDLVAIIRGGILTPRRALSLTCRGREFEGQTLKYIYRRHSTGPRYGICRVHSECEVHSVPWPQSYIYHTTNIVNMRDIPEFRIDRWSEYLVRRYLVKKG